MEWADKLASIAKQGCASLVFIGVDHCHLIASTKNYTTINNNVVDVNKYVYMTYSYDPVNESDIVLGPSEVKLYDDAHKTVMSW